LLNLLKNRISIAMAIVLVATFSIFVFFGVLYFNSIYTEVKASEISNIVSTGVEKIDSLTKSMEQKASDLAVYGQIYYNMKRDTDIDNISDFVMSSLEDSFRVFPSAIGGGVWFDKFEFDSEEKYFGPYVYWDNGNVEHTWELNTGEYDYLNQEWYTFALPVDWDRNKKRDKEYFWTAPYFDDAATNSLVITVNAFIYNSNGKILGISTIDWGIQGMIQSLKDIKITENSNTFLVESNSKTIMTYTLDDDMVMKKTDEISWLDEVLNRSQKTDDSKYEVTLNNIDYNIYYTRTDSGMLYGYILPVSDLLKAQRSLTVFFITTAVIFIIVIIIILYSIISKSIKPLSVTSQFITEISEGEGDLTSKIPVKSNDEVGVLSHSFNKFVESLNQMVTEIKESIKVTQDISIDLAASSEESSAALTEITTNIDQIKKKINMLDAKITDSNMVFKDFSGLIDAIFERIQEQTNDIDKSSSSVEEMIASISSITLTAEKKLAVVDNLKNLAFTGEKEMEETIEVIEKISDSTNIIMNMLTVINNIAAQTNLLAMNAAIEAAHAGDAGKGFSVVADEIRKLAEDTSQNSKDISNSLKEVIEYIHISGDASNKTGVHFKNIVKGVDNVSDGIQEIKNAMQELSIGSEEIMSALVSLVQSSKIIDKSSLEMKDKSAIITKSLDSIYNISVDTKQGILEISLGANEIIDSVLEEKDINLKENEVLSIIGSKVERCWNIKKINYQRDMLNIH